MEDIRLRNDLKERALLRMKKNMHKLVGRIITHKLQLSSLVAVCDKNQVVDNNNRLRTQKSISNNAQKITLYKKQAMIKHSRFHETLHARSLMMITFLSKTNHFPANQYSIGLSYIIICFLTLKFGDPLEIHPNIYNVELYLGRLFILFYMCHYLM